MVTWGCERPISSTPKPGPLSPYPSIPRSQLLPSGHSWPGGKAIDNLGIVGTARELGRDTGEDSLGIRGGRDAEGGLVVSILAQAGGSDEGEGGIHCPSGVGELCHGLDGLPESPQVGLCSGDGEIWEEVAEPGVQERLHAPAGRGLCGWATSSRKGPMARECLLRSQQHCSSAPHVYCPAGARLPTHKAGLGPVG